MSTISIVPYKPEIMETNYLILEKAIAQMAIGDLAGRLYRSAGRLSKPNDPSKKIAFGFLLESVIDSLVNLSPEECENLFQKAQKNSKQK